MHWNEFCERNQIVKREQTRSLNLSKDIPTKTTPTFNYHFHHLIRTIKWVVCLLGIEGIILFDKPQLPKY